MSRPGLRGPETRGYTRVMRAAFALLMTLAALFAPAAARAQDKEDRLVLAQRVDCRAKGAAEDARVPKNSVLLVFDPGGLSADEAWIMKDRAGIVAAVDQLLSFYGIEAVRAREYSMDDAARLNRDDGTFHDVALDYANGSFLVKVTGTCPTAGNTNGFPVCNDKNCPRDDQVYGPELRHYTDDSCVRPVAASTAYFPDHPAARARAYMSAIIVHEFIHAAHQRVLGDLLASEPSTPPKACPAEIPLRKAIELSRRLRAELGLPSRAMHMAHGLMTAGEDLDGDPAWEAGGGTPNMGQCLGDPAVPAALFNDLRTLASSRTLCTEKKVPIGEFFSVPAKNLAYINRHLTKAAAGCHSACYYRVEKAPR